MSQGAPQTLLWVNDELAATLQEARHALEEFIEARGDDQTLPRCADRLHQIYGALRMVEVHGASLLAEEMELVTRCLMEPDLPRQLRHEALEALGRAMVQLPVYMERVISGGRDIPMVLLPLLNELRAVRGHRLMSENTLLLLNLPARQKLALAGDKPEASGEDVRRVARSLRPRFQKALLGWIRNQQPDSGLAVMAQVLERLEASSELPSVYQLWWVTSGVLEALREGGLESSAAVKRLVGQVDREIKRLIEEGEAGLGAEPPVELLNALLFYVARSTTRGTRVAAVRESFDLGELLPDAGELEQARDSLAGPSVRLMHTVSDAIRDDLTRVKDALDIYARTGRRDEADLEEQAELLKKIADTLGVLGLAQLQNAAEVEGQRLKDVASGRLGDDEDTLLSIASALLAAEDRLEAQLVGLVVEADSDEPLAAGPESGEEFRDVASAVMRESLVNMARVKEAVGQAAAGDVDAQLMDAVPRLLREVNASLLLLGKDRAVRALERIADAVALRLGAGAAPQAQMAMDRLADAIVSVEYYLETIQAGRREPEYMLDNAHASLDALDGLATGPLDETDADHAETVLVLEDEMDGVGAETGYDQTLLIESPKMPTELITEEELFAPEETAAYEQPGEFDHAPAADRPDPELLELFIEEARELAAAIHEHFPRWLGASADPDALVTVRRAFHTLKGSGRTVGADRIGNFAWSVESLLNRLIDGTIDRTDDLLRFLEACAAVVTPLIEQFEVGRDPGLDAEAYMSVADAFSERQADAGQRVAALLDGEAAPAEATADPTVLIRSPSAAGLDLDLDLGPGTPDEADTPTIDAESPAAEEEPDRGTEMDPVLRDIFTREAAEHLDVVRTFIAECGDRAEPYRISEAMYRACHTLAGSANMAGVEPAVSVARPLNELIRQLYDDQAGLDGHGLGLVMQASDAVSAMVDTVAAGGQPAPAPGTIPDALEALRSDYALRAEVGAQEPAPPEDQSGSVVPDLDPEILEIFCEEAAEILEEADDVIQSWRASPTAGDPLRTLQRHLHTLKGGARLAGLAGVGDFCHQLESLFEYMQDGRVQPDAAAVDTVQAALDALHRMRDEAVEGRIPEGAPELVASLDALLGIGPAVAADAEEASAVDPAVADWAPQAPVGEQTAPGGPVIEVPAGLEEAPVEEAPVVEAPVEEASVEEASVEEASVEEASVEEAPVEEAPVEEAPVEEAPVEEAPVEEAPVEEAPVEEAPVEEAPVEEAPVEEAPVEEAPVEPERPAAMAPETTVTGPIPPPDLAVPSPAGSPPTESPRVAAVSSPSVPVVPDALSPATAVQRAETARVDAELLETLLNAAGEVGIYRARLEQQLSSLEFNLDELSQTVARLRDQLRKLEIETEAQILHRHQGEIEVKGEFDPLEMDRYSTIQQLSRGLAETATDVGSIQNLLGEQARTADTLLLQQARVITELQDGLMRTRMVPFHRYAPRLSRIVRQTAAETGRRAELDLDGGTVELDRGVAERILAPLEHMLRNAVVHGIERPDERVARNKSETGQIHIELKREGADMIIAVSDDGSGLDFEAIRHKAEVQGLVSPGQKLSPVEAARLILAPGFSTARELTQSAGRGVGMDVVETEIRTLGGTLDIQSEAGKGSRFEVSLPFRRAITQALVVRAGDELFALPLPTVEGVVRIRREELDRYIGDDAIAYRYGQDEYPITHLASLVEGQAAAVTEEGLTVPVLLVRAGGRTAGLLTDELLGAREVVVKPLGPQLSGIRGISGATILGDGRIVLIIDAGALIRRKVREDVPLPPPRTADEDARTFVMVVDDSITVRRVTERLLERNGMRVVTAKDGVDAVTLFQEQTPDIVLLDIEMPRMDGYEVAAHMRADPRLTKIPIIMITSRVGQKHRARAIEAGVDAYLGKPYQESELLAAVDALVDTRSRKGGGADHE